MTFKTHKVEVFEKGKATPVSTVLIRSRLKARAHRVAIALVSDRYDLPVASLEAKSTASSDKLKCDPSVYSVAAAFEYADKASDTGEVSDE